MARTILDGIIFSGLVVLFMIGIILTGPSMLAGQEEIYPRSNVFPLGLYAVDNKSGMQTVKNAGFNFGSIFTL